MAFSINRARILRGDWQAAIRRVLRPSQPDLQAVKLQRSETADAGWLVAPWMLGAAGLLIYLVTLNYWISPGSLGLVASVSGLIWGPEPLEPVTFLATLPLRVLPAWLVPPALNVLNAFSAACILALLARTVSLLPHPAFSKKFKPLEGPPTRLSGPYAWLPPVVAVAVCGLQYTFWENAIEATGKMLDLLLFAYLVRCLPEYSVSRQNSWLWRGAFAYGLAIANDWYAVALFPAILLATCWVRGLNIFDPVFLSRIQQAPRSLDLRPVVLLPVCWLAGFSVFFLKPVLAALSRDTSTSLRAALVAAVNHHLGSVPLSGEFLMVSAVFTLIPVVCIMLGYHTSFAELRRLNFLLPRVYLHLICGFFGAICLWVMLDSPISPRWLELGSPGLPLYYVSALGAGYFSGHFLRLTEAKSGRRRRGVEAGMPRPDAPAAIHSLKRGLVAVNVTIAVAIPLLLIVKNLPVILEVRQSPVNVFFDRIARELPAEGAVVICDDPFIQDYAEAAVTRRAPPGKFLFLNADSAMENPEYYKFLQGKMPAFKLAPSTAGALNATNRELGFITVVQGLAKTHAVFCLQPSPAFDYLAQYFHAQPDGLLYRLSAYPADAPATQPERTEPSAANEAFWESFQNQDCSRLIGQIESSRPGPSARLWARMAAFHPELDHLRLLAGTYCAAALNNRGVELQQRGQFAAATACFDEAAELDANNSAVQINRRFNGDFLAGKKTVILSPQAEDDNLREYRGWKQVSLNGLVDEPNFCNLVGQILSNAGLYRPAIRQFERVKQFAPDDILVSANLAVAYFDGNDYADAVKAASRVLASEPTNLNALLIKGLASVQLDIYEEAIPPLTAVLAAQPDHRVARLNRAVCYIKTGALEAARQDYERVTQTDPGAYSAYYNLAEIAFRDQDTRNSIKYYELFLKYAPFNHPQIALAENRLKVLKTMTP